MVLKSVLLAEFKTVASKLGHEAVFLETRRTETLDLLPGLWETWNPSATTRQVGFVGTAV